MRCSWPLKKNNEGASLVAVVIAILFVMTLGGIVASVTVTNVRMRQVEESSKRNFYSAESVMDEIAVILSNKASKAMQLAYTDLLSDYRNIMVKGGNLQKEFGYRYMVKLQDEFCDGRDPMKTFDAFDSTKFVYVYGYYKPSDIKDELPDDYKEFFITDSTNSTFSADYEDGLFTLYGIKVDYTDEYGYRTTISTDMVFRTPALNFESGYKVKDFMKYALIADDQIQVAYGANSQITVSGSVYSGPGGIYLTDDSDNISFTGNNIVTRGDINISQGCDNAVFGSSSSSIWAENITTSGTGSASSTTLNGNIYVADDLTLNGKDSKVTMTGNYYGYNFMKQYDGEEETRGARYSSAIVINGKGCTLDMKYLQYLHLAGRTYIARGVNAKNDVVLGESLSVRTNQLAYYVPMSYLKRDSEGKVVADFSEDGEKKYEEYINVPNIRSYLKAGEPIAVYHLENTKGGEDVYRYYLNFSDNEQSANDFFKAYSSANATKINAYGGEYANAIIINDTTLYTFSGDVMYRNSASDDYEVKGVTIENDNWVNEGVYYKFADQLAKNYMSLQMYLEDWRFHAGTITESDVRFANDNKDIDLLTKQLLLDNSKPLNQLSVSEIKEYDDSSDASEKNRPMIVVKKGDYTIDTNSYDDNKECSGIVIATGDVTVKRSFKGMIIAGGTIKLAFSGIEINADELLVSKMFAEDASSEDPKFSYLFSTYGNVEENVIGLVQIDKYLTYQNWTRTEN